MNLDKTFIIDKINELKIKANNYQFKPDSFAKFGNDKDSQLHITYVRDSSGGNYPKFLASLVKEMGFKNIVELGSEKGFSTLSIYDALPAESSFITIDLIKDQRYCPNKMFSDPRVKFVFGDVCDLSIFSGKIPMDIDFLFTDTIHFNFQLRDEWAVYQHLLADCALVAIDDINLNDKRGLFDELKFLKWDLTEICHVSGWGLFLFEREESLSREERILKSYQASAEIWRRKYAELEVIVNEINRKKIKTKIRLFIHKHKKIHSIVLIIKKLIKKI